MNMNISSMNSDSFNTLFSSLAKPTGVNALSSVVGDMNSIKNGSYGKLLKSYFSIDSDKDVKKPKNLEDYKSFKRTDYEEKKAAEYEKKKAEEAKKNDASLNSSTSKTEKTAATAAAALSDSVAALQNTDLYKEKTVKDSAGNETKEVDKDKIVSAVKDYVTNFNDMVETGSASSSSGVKTGVKNMGSNTRASSRDLEKIGISVDSKTGKLSVDEDKLKEATADSIKNIFNGAQSYGNNISKNLSSISYYANTATSGNGGYNSSGKYNSGTISNFSDFT